MNDLVHAKLKEIVNLQNFIKEISYIINQNVEKFIILMNIFCLLLFFSYCLKKSFFLHNLRLLFSAREKVINNFKSRLFRTINLDKIQYANQHRN